MTEQTHTATRLETFTATFPIDDTTFEVILPVPPIDRLHVADQALAITATIFRDDARIAGYTDEQIDAAIDGVTWKWSSDAIA
jgi:hypothetical protein